MTDYDTWKTTPPETRLSLREIEACAELGVKLEALWLRYKDVAPQEALDVLSGARSQIEELPELE